MIEINKEEIKNQVSQVIEYSQDILEPKIDELIDNWLENKSWLIEKLGGLIYEVPEKISIDLDENTKQDKVLKFFYDIDQYIIDIGLELSYRDDLLDFIWVNRKNFFQNKTLKTFVGEKTNIRIPEGMKIIKGFKFFFNEKQKDYLNVVQSKASMILQENKIEGHLCFSVHPLDFLSSSENTYNWRSCHSLDGDYCAGNLSYMADKSSLICYLRSDNLEKLPHFPESLSWNSKKWRMLMYLSEDFSTCYAGRQYPFFSKHILNTITDSFLCNVIDRGLFCPSWSAWHCDRINETVLKAENSSNNEEQYLDLDYYIPIRNRLHRLKSLIKEPKHCLHYNDLLLSSCYNPYYCWRDSWSAAKRKIYVGNEVKCVQCEMNLIGKNGNMLCDSCNEEKEYHYCDCCDCRLSSDRSYHVLYNCLGELSPVCDSCFDLCGKMCESCGDYYFNSVIREVNGKKLCPCCYDRQVSTSIEASIPLGTVFYNQTEAHRAGDIAFQNYTMREADLRDLITVETATPTLTPNGNLEIEIGANFNEVLERFLSSPLPITTDNETIVN